MFRSLRVSFCVASLAMGSVASLAHAQTENHANEWYAGARKSLPHVKRHYGRLAEINARKTGIPASILIGIVMKESSGNPKTGNLTQVGPEAKKTTGMRCNVRRSACSIAVASKYLQYLRDIRHLSMPQAVVAYNRGFAAAQEVDPFSDPYYQKVAYISNIYSE